MSAVEQPINKPRRRPAQRKRTYKTVAKWIIVAVIIAVALQQFIYSDDKSPTKQTTKQSTNNTALPIQQTSQPSVDNTALNQTISTWAKTYSFSSSVVVQEVSGESPHAAAYNETTSIVPASTYKIYVAYAILHGIEKGIYTMDTKTADGNTIQTDLTNMIVNSDNDAARTLGFLYGWKNINTLLQSQGIDHTNMYNYVPPSIYPVGDKHTTAADLALVLQKLYAKDLLNSSDTSILLGLMEQQNFRERIPAGIPHSITVADKPGWLTGDDDGTVHVENDAAIVYGLKSTYVLVITTNNNQQTQPLANLSKLIYTQLET